MKRIDKEIDRFIHLGSNIWPAMCKKIPKSRNGSENFPMIPKVRNGSQNSGWFGFAK